MYSTVQALTPSGGKKTGSWGTLCRSRGGVLALLCAVRKVCNKVAVRADETFLMLGQIGVASAAVVFGDEQQ